MAKENPCPCKRCPTRRFYASAFDMQIWGEDCPYECEEYEAWKNKNEVKEGENHEMQT